MSNLNFNTSNNTFRQLLGNGVQYKIPPFQRDYSWTNEEWEDLWQDIIAMFEEDGESAHYMGYLVLQSNNNKCFDIIDGQQRITTMSLIILSSLAVIDELISNKIDPENNHTRLETLRGSYIGYINPVTLVAQPKLELNRHNNKFYQTYLVPLQTPPQRRLNESEHLLRKAFLWFKDKIGAYCKKDGTKIAEFIDTIVDKLFFTVITVTDELNAFKVFETLNARGVRLSATDLLKNYLFSIISVANVHDAEVKQLEDQWESIVNELGSESFPEFLRIYWNSKNKLVRKADLFKTIRKKITNKALAFELIRSLDLSSSIYAALRDPQNVIWNSEESESLAQLQMFNVRQPLAMLMATYSLFYETEREVFSKLLKAVAVISFRYNVICSLHTNEQERIYSEIAYKISNNEISTLEQIYSLLKSLYPSDAIFKSAFGEKELKTTNTRNKKIVRFIMFAIEKQQSGHDFDFESTKYNLEHILPEHLGGNWQSINDQTHEKCLYRLGNITPLETSLNKDIGNKIYQEKLPAYIKSDFIITKKIAELYAEEWGEININSRQKQLANIACGIWRIEGLQQ